MVIITSFPSSGLSASGESFVKAQFKFIYLNRNNH